MIRWLLLVSLLIHAASGEDGDGAKKAAAGPPAGAKKWLTLKGGQPKVVARGGFSGLFPECSDYALEMILAATSLSDVVMLCNLQLTKDNVGLCLTDIRLDNSTNIADVYPKKTKTYKVNGQDVVDSYFSIDYTRDQLTNDVLLVQSLFTRPAVFDGQQPIATVEDVVNVKPPAFWLNVQYDKFYTEHKLSTVNYIEKNSFLKDVNYISSPEIGFLKKISGKMKKRKTKLIFVFQQKDAIEPTTKQTYGKILENLATTIKPLVSGIVVPKDYIYSVNKDTYLDPPTTLVADAHKLGLEVYASGFSNDNKISYNYSYDPVAEYLQFLNNGQFSVDGFLTDFPATASESIACFAAYNATKPRKGDPLIITHNGASGIYAGSSDLAYQQAVDDGADIIDCSVQLSKDGVAFCMDSINVAADTTAMATFMDRASNVAEIQSESGIFSFDLTWKEIQSLQPQSTSPYGTDGPKYPRNPAMKNKGKFFTLAEFLEFAKAKAVTGVLINIENAPYLAAKKGLDIVGAVTKVLSNATFDKQSTQQVLIQSEDTAVLSKFEGVSAYKRVLYIAEEINDVPKQPLEKIKASADAVNLPRFSIIPTTLDGFTRRSTEVVKEMKEANISVYVSVLRNEYISLAFDYFADPTMEVVTFISNNVDGIITEFPATVSRFLRNPCSDPTAELPYTIIPPEPGSLLDVIPPEAQVPAGAPRPPLEVADVSDPPLPAVANGSSSSPTDTNKAAPPPGEGAAITNMANMGVSLAAIVVFSLLLSMGY